MVHLSRVFFLNLPDLVFLLPFVFTLPPSINCPVNRKIPERTFSFSLRDERKQTEPSFFQQSEENERDTLVAAMGPPKSKSAEPFSFASEFKTPATAFATPNYHQSVFSLCFVHVRGA